MPILYELRIRELAREGSSIPFDIELIKVEHHPPLYGVSEGKLLDTSRRSHIMAQRIEVPSDEFESLPPGFMPPLLIQVVGPIFAKWVSCSEAPPRTWGPFDWTSRRMAIEVSLPRMTLPWEQLGAPLGPERVVLLRQLGRDPPSISRYLDGRIEIAMDAVGIPEPQLTIEDLLDTFVHEAAVHGTVAWDRPPEESDIWHLVTTIPENVGNRLRSVKGPRVLVVQVTGGPPSTDSVEWLLETAFERDAWAVLVAEVPETRTSCFFHPFYRKLLHNWPLEFSVWAGMEGLGEAGYPAQLFVRPGGELALSMTRIPPEMVVTPLSDREVPMPAAVAPPPKSRRSRVIADVGSRLEATARAVYADRFQSRIDGLSFGEELHDHGVLAEVAGEIRSAGDADAPLIRDVAASPPGPRHTNVTFFDSVHRRVEAKEPLTPGRDYWVEVVIEPSAAGAHVSELFDESALAEEFKKRETIDLDVVVFSPKAEFAVANNREKLVLPRVGASKKPAKFKVSPQHEKWCALRVAIYYRNTMLQSLAVRAYAGTDETVPDEAVPTIRQDLDWVATNDLQLLEDLSEPVVNIFTNVAPDGSHWIGVFSQNENALHLRFGEMWKLDALDMTNRVNDVRERMQKSHGTERYMYPRDKPPADPLVVAFGTQALIDFAVAGRNAYEYLLQLAEGTPEERLNAFDAALKATDGTNPGIISVARCDSKWTAPWAVLYDKYIDVGRRRELHMCPVAQEQVIANEWEGDKLARKHDLLDDPAACRAQRACPLNDAAKRPITVCPLGFWGFRYQIEQPLQQVKKVGSDEVPEELTAETFNQSNQILQARGQPVRVGAGAFPFPRADHHRSQLEAIKDVSVEWESKRPEVLQLMYNARGHHFVYFYCHGKEIEKSFALEFGPRDDPQNSISPASIEREMVRWARNGNPQPLVVIISCESLAARPEIAHYLFAKLRQVNASGVIGAEISIGQRLGRDVGLQIMRSLAAGVSVGEALLQMRRDLLRRFNPLGLALTANAPATLHLCDDPDGGGACKRYHRVRSC